MKAVFIFTLLVTVCFTSNTSLIAQKILEEYGEVTAENKVLSHYFLYGTHEGKEILGHTKGDKIRVLENKNKVAHRKVAFKTKEGKALLNSVLLKRDEIVTLSLVISNKAEGIYLQTLNYDLTQKREPFKISSLNEISKNSVPSVFRADIASMKVFFNEENENISIVVTVEPNKDGAKKFIEIINLDSEYNVIGQPYVYFAENTDNKVTVSQLAIHEDGTVAAVIQEKEEKFILGYTLAYMDLSGLEPLEVKVQPAYNQIGGLKLSNNTFDAKFSLSIFSVDSEEKSKGAITVYEYNSDKHTVDSKVYGINAEDLNKTEYEVKLEDYTVHEGHFLEDGSHILTLSNSYDITHYRNDGSIKVDYYEKGFIILKIDKNQEIVWVSEVKRNATASGYASALDVLTYYTEDGFMEFIFNTNDKQFETGSYSTNVGKSARFLAFKGTESFVPTKATIDLSSGEVSIKEMTFGDKKVRALTTDEVEKGNEAGIYTIKAIVNKTPTLVKFDFK